jgi:Cupin domain
MCTVSWRPARTQTESTPCEKLSCLLAVDRRSFYILEGEITFTIDGQPLVATAGMFANMPVGMPHSFRNESGKPALMLISVAPAGLEKMFFELGVPLAEGATTALPTTKKEIEKLLKIAPNYGIQILLPKH